VDQKVEIGVKENRKCEISLKNSMIYIGLAHTGTTCTVPLLLAKQPSVQGLNPLLVLIITTGILAGRY
jgi:hypothetical protein